MESKLSAPVKKEYAAKLILMLVFLFLFGAFIYWRSTSGRGLADFKLSFLDLTLLAFATFRMGRLISYDVVMEPLRHPFAQTVPDATGAGESVEPRGVGVRRTLGQLISCPICAGTWVAGVLVCALVVFPGPTYVFLGIMAAIGAAEILNALTEILCWSGQYARVMSGRMQAGGSSQAVVPGESPQAAETVIPDKNNGDKRP